MKTHDIYNHCGYGSESDDADLYYQAWIQKCQDQEEDIEPIFSTPELGI